MSRTLGGICNYCKHLKAFKIMNRQGKELFVCNAFPEGIPSEIQGAYYDHRRNHPEDNGIKFQLEEQYSELPNRVKSMYQSESEQDKIYHFRKQVEKECENQDNANNE